MQKKRDRLYELISRLSPSEKGYINKGLKQVSTNSNLLKLFGIYSKMGNYDEVIIRKKLKGSPILKNLSVTKKQLFEGILKSIRNYHAGKNNYRQVLNLLQDIEFFFEKKMIDECERAITKTIAICNEYEFHSIKIHALDWKRRLFGLKYYQSNMESSIIALNNDIESTIQQLNSIEELEHFQLLLHHNIFHNKWGTEKEKFNQFLDELDLETQSIWETLEHIGNRGRIALTDISARIYFTKGEKDKAYDILTENIEKIEGKINPLLLSNFQRILFVQLGLGIQEKDNWETILKRIERLQQKHPILKQINFAEMTTLTYRLQFNYIHGIVYDETKAETLANFLEQHSESAPMSSWMAFHLSRYYFSYGMFEDAYLWNIRALNQSQNSIKNFTYICKFYMLMLLLELQHYHLVKNAIQELRRFLIRKDRLSDLEKTLITFFKKAENNWNKSTHYSLLGEFKKIVQPHDKELSKVFFYLDIPSWLKSKEKNITLAAYKRNSI